MTVNTTLERRLRDAFARSAATALVNRPAGGDQPLYVIRPTETTSTPRRFGRPALLVGAAAATVALLVTLRETRHDPTPAFRPVGTEVPLTQVAPVDPGVPVDPGSLVGLHVIGHPTVTIYVTLDWQDGHVVEHRCTASDGGAGCSPAWNWAAPDLSATSTVDNRAGTFNLYTWANVPAGTAFVAWNSPSGPVWQRPVAGFVGLPFTSEIGDDRLVAYDAAGETIDAVDITVYYDRLRSATPPGGWQTDPANPEFLAYATTDDLSTAERADLRALTIATVATCLDRRDATWDACVTETETIVDARFAAIGGRIVPFEATAEPDDPRVGVTTVPD
jgi:hypothetical protein